MGLWIESLNGLCEKLEFTQTIYGKKTAPINLFLNLESSRSNSNRTRRAFLPHFLSPRALPAPLAPSFPPPRLPRAQHRRRRSRAQRIRDFPGRAPLSVRGVSLLLLHLPALYCLGGESVSFRDFPFLSPLNSFGLVRCAQSSRRRHLWFD